MAPRSDTEFFIWKTVALLGALILLLVSGLFGFEMVIEYTADDDGYTLTTQHVRVVGTSGLFD